MASAACRMAENLGVRGRIAVGQRPVAGGGDHLVTPDDDASDRNFAGFSGVFGRFQRQIHERRDSHASYHRKKPAKRAAFSKRGYRFCVRMRLERSARALLAMTAHPLLIANYWYPRDHSCPAIATKTTISAAGATGPAAQAWRKAAETARAAPRSKGRSGAARGPEKKFAKRGFAGKASDDGERRPYAGKPDGAKSFGKKPYSGGGKPYAGKRDGDDRPPRRICDAPRPRGDRPFAGRPSRGDDGEKRSFKPREDRGGGDKRPYTPRGDRPNFNRDDRPPRRDRNAGPGDRDDARPAGRSSDRKFGDRKPYTPREGGGEKRPYTPRGEGFRKDGDRPRGDRPFSARPSRDGDRPRGDRPERKFGGDKKFSRGAADRKSDRGDLARAKISAPTAAIQNRGRSVRIAASAIPGPPVTVRAISTSRALTGRATTAAARSVRGFRPSARGSSEVRPSARRRRTPDSAPTGRSIRAAKDGRTIGPRRDNGHGRQQDFSPSVRRSAAAVLIANASPIPKGAVRSRRRRQESRRAHRQDGRARRAVLAPRRRGLDHAGPRQPSTAASSTRRRSTSPRSDVIAVDGKPLPRARAHAAVPAITSRAA